LASGMGAAEAEKPKAMRHRVEMIEERIWLCSDEVV
jgi:hypothetical protein